MAGIFGEFFSCLRLPRNEARKVLEKFGENSEQDSGRNPGRKFEKFGKFSFCNFSGLILRTALDVLGISLVPIMRFSTV